jgi:hypothetical protein
MFKCQSCRKVSQPRESQNTIVVETRPVVYTRLVQSAVVHEDGQVSPAIEETIGHGSEIVREIKVCGTCAARAASVTNIV